MDTRVFATEAEARADILEGIRSYGVWVDTHQSLADLAAAWERVADGPCLIEEHEVKGA